MKSNQPLPNLYTFYTLIYNYTTFTLFYFIIFRALCTEIYADSKITPIVHSPGIYFEPTTNIHFYNDYWKVITHIDLISLEPYLENTEILLRKTESLCDKIHSQQLIQCKDVSSPLDVLLQTNYIKLQSLSHLISNKTPTKVKRSLEFGGEILKFFFGTLDADDARKYDDAIESCQKSETELFHLMKDNIHIVKSTINNFNSTIYKLNQNEIKLNAQINNMNEILFEIKQTDDVLYYISRINSLLNSIESSLLSISNLLDTTLNAILFSKINILHPSVISPLSLFNELSTHSNQLKKRLDFPVELNIDTIHSLIDVSQLSSYYYKNKIVFILQVPLITADKFIVYKNIPLPTPHDDSHIQTFALIQPSNAYIALSDDRLHYAMLDNLSTCKIVSNNCSICELTSLFSTLSNPSCESRLLTEVSLSLPRECNSKLLYGNIDIWQKLRNNNWIYVQSDICKLTIKCDDDINDYSIVGTGTVQLTDNCIGFSKTIQLIPTSTYSFVMKSPLDITFDITTDDCCKKEIFNKTLPLLTPISLSNINLDSLKYASHKMDNLELELNKIQEQSHFIKYAPYYSTLTYILVPTIILFILYKLYKYLQCRSSSNSSGCCIQIFNQCNNKKLVKHKSKMSTSFEMQEVSTSDDEKKSVQSLPIANTTYKSYDNLNRVDFVNSSSRRNLNF
ncbi:unnamed protein product [Plutella xylostella]|uniref:(diamondback moth) hypothetical protein n=1 Tax=Plutella xylostella TaxID=51655 RepID=A0A8S4DU82_PLUXY|nr:unnamed protein product [Plutella xylostella]